MRLPKALQAFQRGPVQDKNSLHRLCRLQAVSRSFDSAGSFASEWSCCAQDDRVEEACNAALKRCPHPKAKIKGAGQECPTNSTSLSTALRMTEWKRHAMQRWSAAPTQGDTAQDRLLQHRPQLRWAIAT